MAAPGVGFAHDTNAVVIVGADGSVADIGLRTKDEVAVAIVDAIEAVLAARLDAHPSRRSGAERTGAVPLKEQS